MYLKFFLFVVILSVFIFPQESQTFLSVKQTGVEEFWTKFPQYNGSGTIIFIFDTGVDVNAEGMLKTPEGKTKVIDVRDFTGEGDLKMFEAETSGNNFNNDDQNLTVKGADKIKSKDGKYFIGALKETDMKNTNSEKSDLNGNGENTDVYVFVTCTDEQGDWQTYFDINANGDLADEKPIKDYYKKFDTFIIKDSLGSSPFTFAINTYPEEKRLSLHFDDGGHGSHCGGIAAGYLISGSNIKGVAPGANVISLKIGNNNYTGGASVTESIKKAYLYADKFSKERKEPCVINMSYGIGSELEGLSELEKFLNKLMKKNPYLYISLSNGNEGPGISSTGLPSSSYYAFSSGAVLTSEIARDLYGAPLPKDELWGFSSRGGEMNKPDVVAPGASVSTVPNFAKGDRMQGTSMASPYSAGVMSLLLSAALKEYPDVKIPSQLLFKAIRESAVRMDGYNHLDQGHGMINVISAWETLKKYIANDEVKNFEKYTITSFAPNMPDNKAQNLYLRDGSFITGKETFSYQVTRENFQKVNSFYRLYNLVSDSDWLIPVQKRTYIRNNQTATINVTINKEKLKKPGLYCARINALRDDKTKMPEFDLVAAVVIPYEFNTSNNYTQEWKNEKVNIGSMKSYFINIPGGQSVMTVNLSKVGKEYSRIRYRLFNPAGQQLENNAGLYTVNNENNAEKNFYNLEPGVYELIVEGLYNGSDPSAYDLSVTFNSIIRIDKNHLSLSNKNIELANYYDNVLSYAAKGKFDGYTKTYTADLTGKGNYRMPFVFNEGETGKTFKLSMSKEDYNKLTDLSFQVVDSAGMALIKESLSYSTGELVYLNKDNKASTNLVLEIIPGFTSASDSMKAVITENTELDSAKEFTISGTTRGTLQLYPSIPKSLTLNFMKPVQPLPEGAKAYGKITFKNSSEKTMYELPIEVDLK